MSNTITYLHCDESGKLSKKSGTTTIVAIDRVPVEERPGLCGPCLLSEQCTEPTFAVVSDYGEDGRSYTGRCDQHKDVDVYDLEF